MTNAPQLVNDMIVRSAALAVSARAYRIAGHRRKARAAAHASAALQEAIASLAVLAAFTGDET